MTDLTHIRLPTYANRNRDQRRCNRTEMSCGELKERWASWLTRKYDGPTAASRAFNVSTRTAEYWFSQDTKPTATAFARALVIDPAAVSYLTGVTDDL